jgi:Uma2 family endonuclease
MNATVRPADVEPAPVPITVDMFAVFVAEGIVEGRDGKVELMDGVLVMSPPPGEPHGLTARNTTMALVKALVLAGLDDAWGVQPNGTTTVDPLSVAVPDLSIVPRSQPGWVPATEALVVIEIAWASIERDTGLKALKYAAAGVREYWVLDVAMKEVIVHTGPGADGWTHVHVLASGAVLSPAGEPRLQVAVADLF